MQNNVDSGNTKDLLMQIVSAMQEKKGKGITSLNLSKIQDSITNYFVICHATSTTQVDAIYDNVVEEVQKNCGIKPLHREGYENSEWILIDYFDIVVHIFREDIRSFYKLEDLWADAVIEEYSSDE
jgi:ribosome-associated protein